MKIKLLAFIASVAFPSLGIAHETIIMPAPDATTRPIPTRPDAPIRSADWSGFYVGALASLDSGTYFTSLNGTPQNAGLLFDPATGLGGFLGVNFQNGSIVYGGELAFTSSNQISATFPGSSFSGSMDAKMRLGFSSGKAMIYGVAGYSFNDYVSGSNGTFAGQGLAFGAGIDVMVTDRLFIGAELLLRNLDGDSSLTPGLQLEADTQAVQIRAGLKF